MTRIDIDVRLFGALLIAAATAGAQTARAVDVVNADGTPREIVVNDDNGESKVVKLAAHQKIAAICESCVVLLGRDSVEASKSDVVKISGGKVSVHSK